MPDGSQQRSPATPIEWGPIVDHALAGDRIAYAKLARLVTGHLVRWRATDFRSDWDDLVQEVLISVVGAYRDGRLESPGALPAYLRQATRFKFIDRIRASKHRARDADAEKLLDNPGKTSPWPPSQPIEAKAQELRLSLSRAVDALPERERQAILEVHVRGRTYEEAAEATGIPLGSLKRALRTGLTQLREALDADDGA